MAVTSINQATIQNLQKVNTSTASLNRFFVALSFLVTDISANHILSTVLVDSIYE